MANGVIKDKNESNLNDKQKQFCIEYLKDLNATRSYEIICEDSDVESARRSGCRLLTNDDVKKYINDLLDEYKDNVDIEVSEIVNELKKISLDPEAVRVIKLRL